jgi:hypothetical protein
MSSTTPPWFDPSLLSFPPLSDTSPPYPLPHVISPHHHHALSPDHQVDLTPHLIPDLSSTSRHRLISTGRVISTSSPAHIRSRSSSSWSTTIHHVHLYNLSWTHSSHRRVLPSPFGAPLRDFSPPPAACPFRRISSSPLPV